MAEWATIIVAAIGLIGTIVGSYIANRKNAVLVAYRLEELEKKVDKYNVLTDRTYNLEKQTEVLEEKLKVMNHRISDLERIT